MGCLYRLGVWCQKQRAYHIFIPSQMEMLLVACHFNFVFWWYKTWHFVPSINWCTLLFTRSYVTLWNSFKPWRPRESVYRLCRNFNYFHDLWEWKKALVLQYVCGRIYWNWVTSMNVWRLYRTKMTTNIFTCPYIKWNELQGSPSLTWHAIELVNQLHNL